MYKALLRILIITCLISISLSAPVYAETAEFEIEGLISPASPKALWTTLEKELPVKVIALILKDTPSGWPVLRVEFDAASIDQEKIEATINTIEDPAGHTYNVHKGAPYVSQSLTKEEEQAISRFMPNTAQPLDLKNPIPSLDLKNPIPFTAASVARGNALYLDNCAKCHGLNGGGQGPSAHGITTPTRPLYTWGGSEASADGYLFWFITNGRTDMPPWGIFLSENERWDLVNYIKSMKAPAQ